MKKINMDKMTKFIKNKNFIIAICVFCLTMLTIGVSYASFFTVKSNPSNQTITTGTLKVTYGSGTSVAAAKENMSSMSDEMGMAQSTASVIYIQNDGSLDSTFNLNIGYDMDNLPSGAKLTPIDYIMVALYEYDTTNKTDTLIVGPIAIADLPIYSVNSDERYNIYSLIFSTVSGNTGSNPTKTYKVKTWLSDKAIPAAGNSYFYLKTEVVAEVAEAKMSYNFTGNLTNGSSALSGAVISFHNNSVIVTTDASGNYTINGVYPGVYNVDITYNDVVYSGNLTVEEGTSKSLASLGSTFSGSGIYSIANTYGTTVSKLIKINNLNTYSAGFTLSSGSLAPTYKFVGDSNENVTLNIQLDTTTNTYTMSL